MIPLEDLRDLAGCAFSVLLLVFLVSMLVIEMAFLALGIILVGLVLAAASSIRGSDP